MQLTFLGTGTSHGIPVIGCGCKVCTSNNEKNKRTRSSVWIETKNSSFIIDIATEFRIQAIREKIKKIDFVLLTHSHADHIHGIDDLRSLTRVGTLPVYGNSHTIADVTNRFSYIFKNTGYTGEKPKLSFTSISENNVITFEGKLLSDIGSDFSKKNIIPVPIKHGDLDIFGYKIGNLAYITDCSFISEKSMQFLEGIEILIIGALRYRKYSSHFTIEEALKIIDICRCKKAFLTHFCHDINHKKLKKELPDHVMPAYDGLKISL
ncbi:MAG: MBL fold metallo-hydrolase [Spirochaetaceae bacterium]|nr:MBL fold metallo-hydrolase [Spirochaetaceae bacterium]